MTSLTDAASEAQPVSQQRPPRVVYVSSAQGRSYADRLPSNIGRSSIVHALIQSLDLVEDDTTNDNDDDESISTSQSTLGKEDKPSNRARAVEPIPAGRSDLSRFHDRDYVRCAATDI